MINAKQKLGIKGEILAAHFLVSKGYQILDQHFCLQGGEIDLVAKDLKNDEIVFVEVKTRTNNNFGYALDSVSEYKLNKIIYSADKYLKEKNLENANYRIDIIGIDYNNGKTCHQQGLGIEIEHLEDAD
jgi:putative endonuclease